jgi:hypothetical protein
MRTRPMEVGILRAMRLTFLGSVMRDARAWMAIALLLALAPGAAPQVPPISHDRCVGSDKGQYLGPINFKSVISPLDGETCLAPRFSEIAHAVLLPPPNSGWVLLWCARYCADVTPGPIAQYKTFLWDMNDEQTLVSVNVPLTGGLAAGDADLFCGGNVISADGRVIVVGGTTVSGSCTFEGHRTAWIFDCSVPIDPLDPPDWIRVTDMARERWYATVLSLRDNRIIVAGHTGIPDYAIPTGQTREYASVIAGPALSWQGTTFNFRNWMYQSNCAKDSNIRVDAYAHLHQLRSQQVMAVVSRLTDGSGQYRTHYLDFNACPADTNEKERWRVSTSTNPLPMPQGAPSIHVVDDSDTNTEWV